MHHIANKMLANFFYSLLITPRTFVIGPSVRSTLYMNVFFLFATNLTCMGWFFFHHRISLVHVAILIIIKLLV